MKRELKAQFIKDRIEGALVELLETKAFSQIRVEEITEKVHISRRTFYLYYKDKRDCLLDILKRMLKSIEDDYMQVLSVHDEAEEEEGFRKLLLKIRSNKLLINTMFINLTSREWLQLFRTEYDRRTAAEWEELSVYHLSQDELELEKNMECATTAMRICHIANSMDDIAVFQANMHLMEIVHQRRVEQWSTKSVEHALGIR